MFLSNIHDFLFFCIKSYFVLSYLVRSRSGMCLKAIFCRSGMPQALFFSETKSDFFRIVDVSLSQKVTFELFSTGRASRRRLVFEKNTYFHNFGHDNFSKSVFLLTNLDFWVIRTYIFWWKVHIWVVRTLYFLKKSLYMGRKSLHFFKSVLIWRRKSVKFLERVLII